MTHSLIFDSCLPHGQVMNNLLYLYLFSIATQYTSYSILRLWCSQTLLLSISELEQNLHDRRQLPITWTLLEVVTKVLTTLSLVCFLATNSEPLNRPRIS